MPHSQASQARPLHRVVKAWLLLGWISVVGLTGYFNISSLIFPNINKVSPPSRDQILVKYLPVINQQGTDSIVRIELIM